MELIDLLPFQFWLVLLVLAGGGVWAWRERRQGWGIPALVVLVTTTVWYLVDVFYNDYSGYRITIGDESLDSAWWQVLLFVTGFLMMARPVHRALNHRLLRGKSFALRYLETRRFDRPDLQRRVTVMAKGLFVAWGVLTMIALYRVGGDVIGLFAPYVRGRADPWARGQIGGGFSAFFSLAGYLQLFLVAGMGVIAAVSRSPSTRLIALVICLLAFPYYIFDRTRNSMLAAAIPGILAWVFLRLKGGLIFKFGVLAVFFAVINFWFGVVMANRSGWEFDLKAALSGNKGEKDARHEGLNMFEELAWIDSMIEAGTYQTNGGERYFAELVNIVPRAIWKNKPMIGLDYALARGQTALGPSGEVTATISTGMIGQGVVNFGRFFGPLAAALLMALWAALLARMDLLGNDPVWILLYLCGLILTFNLGRDISLLVLFPFFFGLGLVVLLKRMQQPAKSPVRAKVGMKRPRPWIGTQASGGAGRGV